MSETNAILRFKTSTEKATDRILFYLDEDTRPDFADEVPANESALCEAMEFADTPIQIEKTSETIIYAWFEFIELDEIEKMLLVFDCIEGILGRHVYFADDEEYRAYFEYRNNMLKPIYTIEDDTKIDQKLWEMDWNEKSLEWVIDRYEVAS